MQKPHEPLPPQNKPLSADWEPVLDSETSNDALESIERVARALISEPGPIRDSFDLPDGNSGLALIFAYLAKSLDRDDLLEAARESLDRAIDQVGGELTQPGLHGGFTGVAWVASHLWNELFGSDTSDSFFAELDESLVLFLERVPYRDYDLITGLVGIGLYGLERMPNPLGCRIVKLAADRIVTLSKTWNIGVTWKTPPDLLALHMREQAPAGLYNLGLAHGIPGIIGFLGQAAGHRLLTEDGCSALERGVDWLLAQKSKLPTGLFFPHWVLGDGDSAETTSRVAWCYGDLGVAASLLVAARCYDRDDWRHEAISIARNCARIPIESTGVVDHGLCHGSAGVAHVFNRMAQLSGDEILRNAAVFWLTRTLVIRRDGEGIDGYASWRGEKGVTDPEPDSYRFWREEGLLTGAGGVALALAAGISNQDPQWDRCLLVSAK